VVSSTSCIHFCLDKHVLTCGKIVRFLSHVGGFTLSRNHWSTTEPFLTTSWASISFRLRTVEMSSGLILLKTLTDLIPSWDNQSVLSSFLRCFQIHHFIITTLNIPSSSPDDEFQSSSSSLIAKVENDDVFFKRERKEKQSISGVTAEAYSYFRGLCLKSQALMGLTKIFNESGTPHTVQIDGEGTLANEVVSDWFPSRQVHVVKTEVGQHFTNGHVECRHRIWKGMSRAMFD
jgi:hypothetical protein